MGMNRGVLAALLSALAMTAFTGCGSEEGGGSEFYPQLPPNGAALYRVGDQVRARVRQDTNGVVQEFESITQVTDVRNDGLSYLIEKLRVQGSRATRDSATWASASDLAPLAVRDLSALAQSCASFGGRMLDLTVGHQSLKACRVVANRMENGVPGSGESWYGLVSFGVLKYRWVSNDRRKRVDYTVTSFVRDGNAFVF